MIEDILKRMTGWERLGTKESQDGSKIIGHIPRDYPEAYLHGFFAPKNDEEWRSYGMKLPEDLTLFYRKCNGLRIFLDSISIYGIRSNYNRDSSAQFQPFDLKSHNKEHRNVWHPFPEEVEDLRVFFGSYTWDGSGIYMRTNAPEVYRVLRGDSNPVNSWSNLGSFLIKEYERLDALYDLNGYRIDKNRPTIPEIEA